MANTIDKIRLSATTYDLVDSTAVHSLDGYPTVEQLNTAITASSAAVLETVQEAGYQTSGDVQNAISGKADTTAVTQSINEAVSGKVDTSTYNTYTAATELTLADKADTTAVTQSISEAVSGKVDTTTYTAYTSATDTTLAGKADISDIPSVSGYADSVKYNPSTQYVEFYHGTTAGTKVFEYDASPFLIDGMVESVVITAVTSGGSEVQVLEITWNSAAGGQVTDIPLSDIFDPTNYYTKSEVDAGLSGKVDTNTYTAFTAATDTALGNKADTTAVTQSITEATSGKVDTDTFTAYTSTTNTTLAGKADTTAVTQSISEATSGKVDTSTYNTYTAATDTAIAGKQDQLVSGTNIKTINNTSILGSGNITIQGGNNVEVSGTTLVFN